MGKQVFVTLLPSTPDSLRAYVLKKDLKGVDISPSNYEYKGSFIWNGEYLSRRGYEKLAKDYVEVLGNEMIKIEFAKFKLRLGM